MTLQVLLKAAPRFAPLEAVHTTTTSASIKPSERLIRRGEQSLVRAYAASLGARTSVRRTFTAAGVTDLWVDGPAGTEQLIEAKSSSDHPYVRQALARLLDYAPAGPLP